MIKEKKQCIKFQRAKAAKVKEFCNIEYHTKKDERAIRKMGDERFIEVWEKIKVNVFKEYCKGLLGHVCIFCIYHIDCEKCIYGKNHGICNYKDSDWRNIVNSVGYLTAQPFTNKFYRDLLNKIMEEKT